MTVATEYDTIRYDTISIIWWSDSKMERVTVLQLQVRSCRRAFQLICDKLTLGPIAFNV